MYRSEEEFVRGQKIKLALIGLILLLVGAHTLRGQSGAPVVTSQLNKAYFYVGQIPYTTTIQSAVTAACNATSHQGQVVIAPGVSPTDSPATQNGCAGVTIEDQRNTAGVKCYSYATASTYAQGPCVDGGSIPSTLTIQTNGTANASQALLNLASTTGTGAITVSNPSGGLVQPVVANTGVTPGTYTSGSLALVVNAAGQIVSAGSPFTAALTCVSISCASVEAGVTTTSPATFTAAYTNPTVPTSASISDGTNTTTLTTPFTSGSLAHSYCTTAQGLTSFTFTLTALGNGQTVTSPKTITCTYRTFVGPGTGGATGATASGTTAVLAGATGTLASGGLGNQGSYTCTTSGSQYCYILMAGGSHTFTSGGFAFPMNTPTSVGFANVNGVTTPLYLYQSSNTVTNSTFVLVVASFLVFPFRAKRRTREMLRRAV